MPQSITAGDVGLVSASAWKNATVSSYQTNAMGMYALDECPHTAWFPKADDAEPVFSVDLEREHTLYGLRIIWAEQNADVQNNINYGAVKYQVKFYDDDHKEIDFMIDKSSNERDLTVEFIALDAVKARYAEIKILRNGNPLICGLTDFSVFVTPRKIYS